MKKLLAAGIVLTAVMNTAQAADMPAKAPMVVQSGGVYVWADGSYQSVGLPTYDLGFRTQAAGQGIVAANTFDPRATGYGVSGGIGFVLPPGMLLSNVGTNARIEFNGSYVKAKASQSGSTVSVAGAFALPSLNGVTSLAGVCGANCVSSGALASDYSSWNAGGRFATDYKVNTVTLTPSLAVFGGKSRSAQTLAQSMTIPGSVTSYSASTTLDWTDWGGRAGLSGSIPVTNWLTFVAGGNVGVAARKVSFTGSDSGFADLGGGVIIGPFPSSIAVGQSTTAFVANAETSVIFKFAPSWSLRAFAGLNYDNKVPGILAPGVLFAGGTSTPAAIKYQAEPGYYAGSGLTAKF